MIDSKNLITATIKLMVKHSWLRDRKDAFDFLQKECLSGDEHALLFDLLDRFEYWENQALSDGFDGMVTHICDVWKLLPANTIICPPKLDSDADSGPAVVQTLKTILGRRRITNFELFITINKIKDHSKTRSVIVLVDDFAGTGKTISNKLKTIKELKGYVDNPPEIYVCLLAASRLARETLKPQVKDYFVWREYEKGISDYYAGSDLSSALATMSLIESRLNQNVKGVNIPKLGYGGTEVLMGWDSNLPNSVFPLFWWPESSDPTNNVPVQRETLFNRYF